MTTSGGQQVWQLMALLVRRTLVIIALMFWQGGFTFYSSVAVPIGTSVLGSSRRQGFITQQVTHYLNLSACVALVPLYWDLIGSKGNSWIHRKRRYAWLVMAVLQIALIGLHAYLDQLMDSSTMSLVEVRPFVIGHRWYLWISTFQWLAGLVFLVLSLIVWRKLDAESAGAIRAPGT